MKSSLLCMLVFAGNVSLGQTILPPAVQIKTALLAAPPEQRSSSTVLGYDPSGKMVTLQKGKGNLVCLCDDPKLKGIKVACYSVKLEPFMARGRELIAAGKTEEEKQAIRKKEVESGKLKMPKVPSFLYVLTGTEDNYDIKTGDLKDGNFRYVIYMPYATAESTGLPTKPFVAGMPWLMDAGTYGAHVMITPAKK